MTSTENTMERFQSLPFFISSEYQSSRIVTDKASWVIDDRVMGGFVCGIICNQHLLSHCQLSAGVVLFIHQQQRLRDPLLPINYLAQQINQRPSPWDLIVILVFDIMGGAQREGNEMWHSQIYVYNKKCIVCIVSPNELLIVESKPWVHKNQHTHYSSCEWKTASCTY